MAEERIDVVVTDKVAASVVTKLESIATSADKGATHLKRLQAALASVNATALDRLASAMAKADSAQARLISAQARLTNAQNAGSVAAQKMALAQQKIATESARTEAAVQRAAQATSAAALAAGRLQAATAATTGASSAGANAQQQLASATGQAGAAASGAGNQFRQYVASIQAANTAASGAMPAGAKMAAGMNSATGASMNYQRAARQTTAANANIIAQMQDIGVSLAGGQNPLLVMIQQGSQLSYIATTMDGGMKALLGTMLRLIAPFTLIAGAIGLLYKGFSDFTSEMASKHKPGLENYARSLGLTSDEMKKLSNETVGANGKLKEFDQITITNADSWKGFVATVMQGLSGLVEGWGVYNEYLSTAWSATTKFMYNAFLGFYASVHTLIELTWKTFVNTVRIISNTIIVVANSVVMVIQDVVNAAIIGINLLSDGANSAMSNLGIDSAIPQIKKVELGINSVLQSTQALESMDIGATFASRVNEANRTIEGFSKAWDEAANAAARARLEALAAAIIQNRGPGANGPKGKVDRTADKEAFNIGMVNLKLDDELAGMKMLKQERDIQQKMDQIEQSLTQKKIKLNDTERASILAKVTAIEEYKYVQAESDRIMEEANGPARTMKATVEAATQRYDEGSISLERYTEELRKATRQHEMATDPFFKMNEEIDSAMRLTGKYGIELERVTYLEGVRQKLAEQGKSIYDAETGSLTAKVAALVAENDALREKQYIQQQVSAVLNPILENQRFIDSKAAMYAEIEAFRQKDVRNEGAAAAARAALNARYDSIRLGQASQFFGDLATLSSSGNKKIALIGKAAAIAQATIQGIMAVQNALATPAPWPIPLALAAAAGVAAAANVAKIVSSPVGNYATGGQFMVDGKSGIDANNINMNVTRGERVTVETPAQQRAAAAGSGGAAPMVNVKSVTVFDPRNMLDAMDTSEGERVVMNIVERRSGEISRMLGG